ncbi:MAG: hypothetical protein K9M07_01875 [Simkaniaceae bacterium]|nr:hypothetical protein [Simkaniaceae bacterium]
MIIALFGSTGNMGSAIRAIATDESLLPFSYSKCDDYSKSIASIEADVAIDVSSFKSLHRHIETCVNHKIPLVIGTTGLSPEHFTLMQEASLHIPLFYASNFSLKIAWIKDFLKQCPLDEAYIDIIESHPANKKDAPSGTALDLASAMSQKTYQRELQSLRSKQDLYIHSIRSHSHTFSHEVRLAFDLEELRISHLSFDRRVFAKGALQAAAFLRQQNRGLYNMDHLIAHLKETYAHA